MVVSAHPIFSLSHMMPVGSRKVYQNRTHRASLTRSVAAISFERACAVSASSGLDLRRRRFRRGQIWSPRVPSGRLMPRPRSRKRAPLEVPGGTVTRHRALDRGDFDLGAQRRLGDAHRQVQLDVVAVRGAGAGRAARRRPGRGRRARRPLPAPARPCPGCAAARRSRRRAARRSRRCRRCRCGCCAWCRARPRRTSPAAGPPCPRHGSGAAARVPRLRGRRPPPAAPPNRLEKMSPTSKSPLNSTPPRGRARAAERARERVGVESLRHAVRRAPARASADRIPCASVVAEHARTPR